MTGGAVDRVLLEPGWWVRLPGTGEDVRLFGGRSCGLTGAVAINGHALGRPGCRCHRRGEPAWCPGGPADLRTAADGRTQKLSQRAYRKLERVVSDLADRTLVDLASRSLAGTRPARVDLSRPPPRSSSIVR